MLVVLAGPAVLSDARGRMGLEETEQKKQSEDGDAVRGTEWQESKEVENKEQDKEEEKASAAQLS